MLLFTSFIQVFVILKPVLLISARLSLLIVSIGISWFGVSGLIGPTVSPALEFPPTQKGAPRRTAGGGTREPKDRLIALLPDNGIHSFAGTQATLMVSVPEGLSQDAVILILDGDDILFLKEFKIPASQGLMGITFPEEVIETLNIDQVYEWEFAVVPDGTARPEEQIVQGKLQRVEIDTAQIIESEPLAKAEFYAQRGIWQETVLEMAPLQANHPTEWQSLLGSVKLDKLQDIPWVGMVSLDS